MADQYVLVHHGILGQKWGIRRFQNKDGSLTSQGRQRYSGTDTMTPQERNEYNKNLEAHSRSLELENKINRAISEEEARAKREAEEREFEALKRKAEYLHIQAQMNRDMKDLHPDPHEETKKLTRGLVAKFGGSMVPILAAATGTAAVLVMAHLVSGEPLNKLDKKGIASAMSAGVLPKAKEEKKKDS